MYNDSMLINNSTTTNIENVPFMPEESGNRVATFYIVLGYERISLH